MTPRTPDDYPLGRALQCAIDWLYVPVVFAVVAFVKQLGADVRDRNDAGFEGCEPHEWPDVDPADVEHDLDGTCDGYQGTPVRIHLRSRKGNDMAEWPEDLRVRQMPRARRDYRAAPSGIQSEAGR